MAVHAVIADAFPSNLGEGRLGRSVSGERSTALWTHRSCVVQPWVDLDENHPVVDLYRGTIRVKLTGREAWSGDGVIQFDWHRGIWLSVETSELQDPSPIFGGGNTVDIPGMASDVPVTTTTFQTRYGDSDATGRTRYEAVAPSVTWGGGLAWAVRFDVGNFPSTRRLRDDWPWERPMGRIRLVADGWMIVLDELDGAHDRREKVKRTGGGCVTHTGILTRADGAVFDVSDRVVGEILHALQWMLSFAAAAWVPIICPTGIGADGAAVWGSWASSRRSEPRGARWMSPLWAGGLAHLWPGWWAAWRSSHGHDVLRWGLPMYVAASLEDSLELKITTAFNALEVVAWHRLAQHPHGPQLSTGSLENMRARTRLRQMLGDIGAPTFVPPGLGAAVLFAGRLPRPSRWEPVDGPYLVANVRNRIVHPRDTSRITDVPVEARYEVWELAMWYFELALFRLCGFGRPYLPRPQRPSSVMSVDVPPWTTPEEQRIRLTR